MLPDMLRHQLPLWQYQAICHCHPRHYRSGYLRAHLAYMVSASASPSQSDMLSHHRRPSLQEIISRVWLGRLQEDRRKPGDEEDVRHLSSL